MAATLQQQLLTSVSAQSNPLLLSTLGQQLVNNSKNASVASSLLVVSSQPSKTVEQSSTVTTSADCNSVRGSGGGWSSPDSSLSACSSSWGAGRGGAAAAVTAAARNSPVVGDQGQDALLDINEQVFKDYQEWALRTYGDAAKTKTVTKKKYERIVNILNGQETQSLENSKFRFWVKSKGFRLCRKDALEVQNDFKREENLAGLDNGEDEDTQDFEEEVLYLPCSKSVR